MNKVIKYKKIKPLSLKWLLIISFVLQIIVAVGLVGYLSYRSGQQAVEKLTEKLMVQLSNNIQQHLNNFLGKAQDINRTNVDAFKSGIIDLNNFKAMSKYFYKQMRTFNFTTVNFGKENGDYIGVNRIKMSNELAFEIYETLKSGKQYSYAVDTDGNRLKVNKMLIKSDNRDMPMALSWYTDAVFAKKPTWSAIYGWYVESEIIAISASTPIYDVKKQLIGVFGIDLDLLLISDFLKTLSQNQAVHIFIVDASGLMIASSDESPIASTSQSGHLRLPQFSRLNPIDSHILIIRETIHYLIKKFGSLQTINQSQLLHPKITQNPFIKVIPYRDNFGLDWRIVIIIPESEFMGEIQANTRVTLLLCLLTLFIAISLAVITAGLITKPIRRLSKASADIAKGKLHHIINIDGVSELKTLAMSFNLMAHQLEKSFENLEQRVKERTAELEIAKKKSDVANQAKSIFLSNMNHELRTPLNGILGYTQILKRDKEIMKYQQAETGLAVIERSGTHLLHLISDILDLSKIEARKIELITNPFCLEDMLSNLCAIINATAKQKNLDVKLIIPPDLPICVLGDEKILRQVLLNLLSNAVKFTDNGEISLHLERLGQTEQDIHCRFAVIDNGIGIAESDLAIIFQAFKQVGDQHRKNEGTGLGLAISSNLVQLMGGDLQVKSILDQGSHFWFDLNLPIANTLPAENDKPLPDTRQIITYHGKRQKILLVDDVGDNILVLASILTSLGFDIMVANNGREALDKIPDFQPDLIITDLIMPVMTGFELIRILRQDNKLRHLKVVSISASFSLKPEILRNKYDFDEALEKPLQLNALFSALESQLALKWIYDTEIENTIYDDDTVLMRVPELMELNLLYELTQDGDFVTLNKRLEKLTQYPLFAKKIKTFAKTYQDKEIYQFLASCKQEKL